MPMAAQTVQDQFVDLVLARYDKPIYACTDAELYAALLDFTASLSADRTVTRTGRKLYYVSAEFLVGKLLSNNLIALGAFEDIRALLAENSKDLATIEGVEPEPSLGNGGLGRLAACFLDSVAALDLNGDGIGLNYHYGLFRQVFAGRKQHETPDPWITDDSWLIDTGVSFQVPFGGFELTARMLDVDVVGNGHAGNKLHLFDVEQPGDASGLDGIDFDKTDIARNLTMFLYPDDSDEAGRLLRIYQQYFMVSAGAQLILRELDAAGHSVTELDKHVVVQINDTHPSLIIPELIRLLVARGIDMDDAAAIVSRTCAYTNHTILAEALEKWPIGYLRTVVPHLVPIIERLDSAVKARVADERVAIIDSHDRVHMAHMDIHYSFSVNGVAELHSKILKESELRPFAELYPDRFTNVTNGITFRRWLIHCNPGLAEFLDRRIGPDWRTQAGRLEDLLQFADDESALRELIDIKAANKRTLTEWLATKQGVDVDPESIFDIQIKRLHEYKRQQMNALYVIDLIQRIRNGYVPARPLTVIFGAKAAPAYYAAKDIIHLILCLQDLIAADPLVSAHLRLVMVENYNVQAAAKLVPACDISEQISLASKEASGTGNMKFMLNGAVTLGTFDGANVEISQAVGADNIFIFGADPQEIIDAYADGSYDVRSYYEQPAIKALVDFIVSPELLALGDEKALRAAQQNLAGKDWFMALRDVEDYIATKDRVLAAYEDRLGWARMTLVNIAKAGFFSSDRSIADYNERIWHL